MLDPHSHVISSEFERASDPIPLLRQYQAQLRPGGILDGSFYNAQSASNINALLQGDDSVHSRSFTLQGFFRALLDEGFVPSLTSVDAAQSSDVTSHTLELFKLIQSQNDVDRSRALGQLMSIEKFHFRAVRQAEDVCPDFGGVAFLVCSRGDKRLLSYNIHASPDIADPKNQLIIRLNNSSPADVYEEAVRRKTDKKLLVYIHDDVYIPRGWSRRVWNQFFGLDRQKPVGVAGLFGVSGNRLIGTRSSAGSIIDLLGLRTMRDGSPPQKIRVVDGLCLITKNGSGIVPDPSLGFHFYDADMCMQAEERGEHVIALDAPALHSSTVVTPPAEFQDSMNIFKRKWGHRLPLETPCAVVS